MNFTEKDIQISLESLPVNKGDLLFIHSNIGFFGRLEGAKDVDSICSSFFKIIKDLIGPEGTIVVPAFTYSFPKGEIFSPERTANDMGIFSEWLRCQADSHRSLDTSYSVIANGKLSCFLTENATDNSFGKDSFFHRFEENDGIILNLNFDAGSTFLHYLEREMLVPYRFDKTFEGRIQGEQEIKKSTIFVRYMDDCTYPAFELFDRIARKRGKFLTSNLGRGQVGLIRSNHCRDILKEEFRTRPYLLTSGNSLKEIPRFKKENNYVPI